jgi:hypothetical protein
MRALLSFFLVGAAIGGCASADSAAATESAVDGAPRSVPLIELDPSSGAIAAKGPRDDVTRRLPGMLAGAASEIVDACAARIGASEAFVRFDDGTPLPSPGFVVPPLPRDCGGGVDCIAEFIDGKGCRAVLFQETFERGTTNWGVDAFCDRALCAKEPIAALEIVPFDAGAIGRGSLATVSGRPISSGSKIILDVHLAEAASAVEDARTRALVPHLHVRFGDGAFEEIPALPALPHQTGTAFDDASLDGYVSVLTIPAGAARLELYLRFERWQVTREVVHDAPPHIHVHQRASDGFVSNFGKNFVLRIR